MERNCTQNDMDTIVPQVALSLDDAIHLAQRLEITLGLSGTDYIFYRPKQKMDRQTK